jgi:Tol biopolymer transport system component
MTEHPLAGPGEPASEQPLESWKEIAAYVQRGVRTVKRWEESEGLPVRRHVHQARSSVYAYPSELDAWRASRRPTQDEAPQGWMPHPLVRVVAFAAVLLVTLLAAGDARLIGRASAAAESQDVTTRRVWAGSNDVEHSGISPDGRLLTFVDWTTGDLAVRDLVSGQNRHLTSIATDAEQEEAWYSIFSPDGTKVAYAWYTAQQHGYDLRLVGVEAGATPRILYRHPDVSEVRPVDWSADGTEILALLTRRDKTRQMVLVSVTDGSARVLKSFDSRHPGRASLSPDGRYVAYDFPPKEASERDIFVLATDGSREAALVQHAADDRDAVWTPDGDRILFVSNRTGTPSLWAIGVSEGKPQGAPALVKADVRGQVIGLTRGRALYYGFHVSMSEVHTARVDPAGAIVLDPPGPLSPRFMGSTNMPDWSPDGKYLSYLVGRTSGPDPHPVIMIRSLATGEERELKADVTWFLSPRWSPDGRSFVAWGKDVKGRQGVLRIDARTGAATLLVQARLFITGAAWSPDGKAVFYWDAGELMRRDLARGVSESLAKAAGANFAISPDGQSLVVFRGGRTLDIMPAKGGEARELVRLEEGEVSPGIAFWTPDGRYVLFTKGKANSSERTLWSVPARGGAPNRIDLTMPLIRSLRIHPDGKRIAFTAGEELTEVWVLENFLRAPAGK